MDQLEHDTAVVDSTARLPAGLVRTQPVAGVRSVLPEALPWVTFLPDDDVDTLLDELIATARGATALDNLAPIALLLDQWRHTAEVHADPALHALVTREPSTDDGAAG